MRFRELQSLIIYIFVSLFQSVLLIVIISSIPTDHE